MKKLLLFVTIALFGLTANNAQEVKFGAKAGVNITNVSGDAPGQKARTAFHLGGVAKISLTDKLSFQPELLYSLQGYKYDRGDFEGKYKFDYLNVPLMAKFMVADGLSLEAGPQVGFLLSAKDVWESDSNSGTLDVKEDISGTDIGVNFGIGYELESGLNFAVRYNLGLSEIYSSSDFKEFFVGNNRTSAIQISVGYFFN
ncbi:MAG: PorT family protein [Maribacter sp.]|nr:PorT family protein [Maribacter sp.]